MSATDAGAVGSAEFQRIAERVEALEETVEEQDERIDELESENEELRDRLRDQEKTTTRTAGMFAKIINEVREYDTDEGEGVTPDDPDLPKEAGNVAEELHDTMEFCRENNELLKIRERDHDQQKGRARSKVRKQLDVLNYAKKHAKANEKAIWRLDYKTVAAEYGCHKNDAYRVMRDMADEVPGVLFKDGRTMDLNHRGIGGKHLEVQLKHPDIHAWMRAREE